MTSPACPLCAAPVDGDDTLRVHLDVEHDLRDDPGARTSVSDLVDLFILPIEPEPGAAATTPPEPELRLHDPYAGDERYKPVVLGVGGILLLLLAVIVVVTSGL